MTIERDPKSSKKIWVAGIIPNQKYYALIQVRQDERMLSVPPQTVGEYRIDIGCITYDDEKSVLISMNNKSDCAEMDSVDVSVARTAYKRAMPAWARMDRAPRARRKSAKMVQASSKVVGVTFIGAKVETE